MPDSEYTPGEIARSLKRIEGALEELSKQMVRKDVYTAQREADRERVAEIAKDADKAAEARTWARRAVATSLMFPVAILVIGLVIQGVLT